MFCIKERHKEYAYISAKDIFSVLQAQLFLTSTRQPEKDPYFVDIYLENKPSQGHAH